MWTLYPLTTLLEQIGEEAKRALLENKTPRCILVELCSVAERAFNYLHTGNALVIATSFMNLLWIGQALIKDGLPCITGDVVLAWPGRPIVIEQDWWPFDTNKNMVWF
jgi:hypothetical protein